VNGLVKIGLEVHVHLNTLNTKLFCACSTDYAGRDPNTLTCPVCLGLPGATPVLNEKALRTAIMTAYALNMKLSPIVVFSRKHYFYPDMAKNYQISQYDGPGSMAIAYGGHLKLSNGKVVRLRRMNIEEDPAKSIYPTGSIMTSKYTLLDYNRSGIGLLEIVTEPDLEEPKEAREFLERLRSILEHLGVCNCDLEGSLRADCNVSVEGGERVEVKNVGSARDVEQAIAYEIARQKAAVSQGLSVSRETRHWDSERKVTVPLRLKESEEDYRYFPDPELPPYRIPQELIEEVKSQMPELPESRAKRLSYTYGISDYIAQVLVSDKRLADLFEQCSTDYNDYRKLANLLVNDFLRWIKENGLTVSQCKAKSVHIVDLLKLLDQGKITIKIAKDILPKMITEGVMPSSLLEQSDLIAIRNMQYIEDIINQVMNENPDAVNKAKSDPKVINFLVGMVMKKSKKRIDPKTAYTMIEEKLRKSQ
jgi:aspartyl-tRNA(Asn)/glutamyl-tRNA(Gln) amidotransferase subunit B